MVSKNIIVIVTCDVVIICIIEKYILIKTNHENMLFSNIQKMVMMLTKKIHGHIFL